MKWFDFYSTYFSDLEQKAKQNVKCVFHEDTDPSLSLDLETGLYFCHGCKAGGDVFSFYMKKHGCSFTKAKRAILKNEKTPVLSETEVEVAHQQLLLSPVMQKVLTLKRGWTLDVIKRFKLGWMDERIYIPIHNKENELVNIRKYDVLHKHKHKFTGIAGFNTISLWPMESLNYDFVLVLAGEPDTILANQLGMPAITFTGGEGNFKESLLPAFEGKKVYIAYDPDKTGVKGMSKLSERMCQYADCTYVINMPKETGDFTDLFLYCLDKNTSFLERWNKLVEEAVLVVQNEIAITDVEDVDFYSAVKDEYFNKNIRFKAIAIGKNLSPFFAPKHIKANCSFTRGDSCKECKMFFTGGETIIEVSEENMLDLIKCPKDTQEVKIKKLLGIRGCSQFRTEVTTQNIEEVFIAPLIDSERTERQFITRKVYTNGHNISLNKTYSFEGKTISDAKTQEATHLFYKQTPELTDLDTFSLSYEDIQKLKIFNPIKPGVEGVSDKFREIHRDITYNVPEVIVGRETLMLAYDLVFHSVLRFKFTGSMVEKGWAELIAIGDTRTGKTKTALKMCKHYKVGEYLTLESATLPGLVGGMSQFGKDLAFSWGVIPINDGRLVILDEVNGMKEEMISNLSSLRDNGIAERTIVGSTRKTSSRVRMIWISNPRSRMSLSEYSSGVEAIRELIGKSEDISRFDLGIICAKEDVNILDINTQSHIHPLHEYTSELCNKCIMWSWSRKEKHIHFTDQAEKDILTYAIEMAGKYSDSIPLVQGSVQRIKIAKLAVAVACRMFSTEDGENVIVKPEHVEFVVSFLNSIYDSTYFGYQDYSKNRIEEGKVKSEGRVETKILQLQNQAFINKMLSTSSILFDDIVDFARLSRESTRELISFLVNSNCLKRKNTAYIKTPEFIRILKGLQKLKEVK